MQIDKVTHEWNGNKVVYKFANGTYYHKETNDGVIQAIERARAEGWRVRIFEGDTTTGVARAEENDTMGTIGRSSGQIKVPLLIHTKAHIGGPALLDNSIVAIRITGRGPGGKKVWLYKHPNFSVGLWGFRQMSSGFWTVEHNGMEYARERTYGKAWRLCLFMRGDRDSK